MLNVGIAKVRRDVCPRAQPWINAPRDEAERGSPDVFAGEARRRQARNDLSRAGAQLAGIYDRRGGCDVQEDVVVRLVICDTVSTSNDCLVLSKQLRKTMRSVGKTHSRSEIVQVLRELWNGCKAERQAGVPKRIRSGLLRNGQIVQQVKRLLRPLPTHSQIQGQILAKVPIVLYITRGVFLLKVKLCGPVREVVCRRSVADEVVESRERCSACDRRVCKGVSSVHIGKKRARRALLVVLAAEL